MVDVGILSSKTRDRVWCPGLGEPRMGLQSPPRPACPGTWLFRAAELFFLCSYAQGREKSAGAQPFAGPGRVQEGKPRRSPLSPPKTPASWGDPTLERGSRQASSGRSLGLITHGQRCWCSDSGHGHPHSEEERGRRGGRRAEREEGREGGPWRLRGAGGGGIAQGIPLVPAPLPRGSSLLAPFSTLDPPKFFYCEFEHLLLSPSQLFRASLYSPNKET